MTSKSTETFFISHLITSLHVVSLFSQSISYASLRFLGIRIPYLLSLNFTQFCTDEMVRFRFFNACGVHHANTGSLVILLVSAYSATSIGLDSFQLHNGIHDSDPSHYFTRKSHPFVVIFRYFLLRLSLV